MATKPTNQQIHDLAERRTIELGYPQEPTAAQGDPRLYRERQDELFARQLENARLSLTNAYERDRDREQRVDAQRQRDEAAFEADLRERFRTQFPGAPESDFAVLRPTLLAQVAEERHDRQDADVALARRRVRL